ncbi:helix-turn-helix transcriptional regulator [Hyphomonas sp.]|uniref:helix-turn-helix domain-containing protein n=1 Tax=Hyphomonas sp. TaxID=87 RepID=UPI0025BBC829|nr:helix-turn-helix transcriptional regulator [Hyphomonas sp.]
MRKPVRKRSGRKAVGADLIVGANIRQLRTNAGLTLSALAAAMGISHQQLHKYESETNRISAGMLFEIAQFFTLPVDALFEGHADTEGENTVLQSARRRCHGVIDRTTSLATLETMAKILRALSSK